MHASEMDMIWLGAAQTLSHPDRWLKQVFNVTPSVPGAPTARALYYSTIGCWADAAKESSAESCNSHEQVLQAAPGRLALLWAFTGREDKNSDTTAF
jgi:hypothetical protein